MIRAGLLAIRMQILTQREPARSSSLLEGSKKLSITSRAVTSPLRSRTDLGLLSFDRMQKPDRLIEAPVMTQRAAPREQSIACQERVF